MAKILRKNQKVFAGNAINNGQFGSAQDGSKVLTNDPDVIQALSAFLDGWDSATLSSENLPTLEEMQGLQYLATRQVAYLFQEGIAEYEVATTYYINSIVKKTGTYELYGSIIDNNVGNALPAQVDDANWKYIGDLSNLNIDLSSYAKLNEAQSFIGGQRASETVLTSTAASIAIDFSDNNNFTHTTTENTTIANPSNVVVGQSGAIRFTQGATPRSVALGSYFIFQGGEVPNLTQTVGAKDTFFYEVRSATEIELALAPDWS